MKIQLYESLVVPTLLYNAESWAAPKHTFEKLDATHRKQLRIILKLKFPQKIANETLYKTAKVTPLSARVERARWKMIGKVLRQPESSPSQLAFMFAINASKIMTNRKGRPYTNIYDTIRQEIQNNFGLDITKSNDLEAVKEEAKNIKKWELKSVI